MTVGNAAVIGLVAMGMSSPRGNMTCMSLLFFGGGRGGQSTRFHVPWCARRSPQYQELVLVVINSSFLSEVYCYGKEEALGTDTHSE